MRDTAYTLSPLATTLARMVMENTRIYKALRGVRGHKPVDMARLEELLVRFSELVIENPRIADIELNPRLAGPDCIMALDAPAIQHPAPGNDAGLPRPTIGPAPSP